MELVYMFDNVAKMEMNKNQLNVWPVQQNEADMLEDQRTFGNNEQ